MFKKVEHIGIAVKDLKSSDMLFEKLLGKSSYKKEHVESENVSTSFYRPLNLIHSPSPNLVIHYQIFF